MHTPHCQQPVRCRLLPIVPGNAGQRWWCHGVTSSSAKPCLTVSLSSAMSLTIANFHNSLVFLGWLVHPQFVGFTLFQVPWLMVIVLWCNVHFWTKCPLETFVYLIQTHCVDSHSTKCCFPDHLPRMIHVGSPKASWLLHFHSKNLMQKLWKENEENIQCLMRVGKNMISFSSILIFLNNCNYIKSTLKWTTFNLKVVSRHL